MISIDRNLNPVIDADDINNLINQLKPLEVETLWEVITEHEQIQRKTDTLKNLSVLLEDAEDHLHELMRTHNVLLKQIENLQTELNKNV
jgi:hypothetical protein